MEYARLSEYYRRLEETTSRLQLTDILVELLREADPQEVPKIVYLTQGKLYPDFAGVELGLAEKLILKSLNFATGVPDTEIRQTLIETGDIGDAAAQALQQVKDGERKVARQATLFGGPGTGDDGEEAPLELDEVYERFEEIAQATGSGSQDRKMNLLKGLLLRADPASARYIVRTVAGRLRLGIADMTLLDALAVVATHPEHGARSVTDMTPDERERYTEMRERLERAYNVSSDLGLVSGTLLQKNADALDDIHLTVGVPIRAMLAERLPTAEEILDKLGGVGLGEWKYDGLRLQAHIQKDGTVRFFTRRLEEVTGQFPDVAEHLRNAFQGQEAIVEGEAVAVDPDTLEMRPFQEISRRRGRKHDLEQAIEEVPITMYLFDLLLLDGEDYTDRPLSDRRATLESKFTPHDGIQFSHAKTVRTPEELQAFFEQSLAENTEGIMVKSVAADSGYRAGNRGWQWIKYKREYEAELNESLDLVIVGALAGRGRRKGWYGALLCAAYNPEEDVFETVCKLGTGFDDETLAAMNPLFEPHVLDHRHPRVRSKMDADYWFEPVKVAEVVGAELSLSPIHTAAWGVLKEGAGLAVRFPRFTGWRDDKQAEAATTTTEILAMYRAQRRMEEEDAQTPGGDA